MVLGIAIYAMVDGAALVDLLDGSDVNIPVFTSAAIILIVVSVFIVILTFFGCCGAIKESKCMLGTYFTLVLVMFIIMIVGAVLGYSQSLDEVGGALKDSMKQFVDEPKDETDTTKKAITDAWNQVQTDVSFSCQFSLCHLAVFSCFQVLFFFYSLHAVVSTLTALTIG